MSSIKSHFTSRYPGGYIIEADWASLELYGWAYLTRDPTLLKLIREGQDPHRYVGSMVLNCRPEDIDDATRKQLKARNFLLVYGGYWTELVRTHGMTREDAERLYTVFWDTFPTARMWQDNVCSMVECTKQLIDEYTPLGHQKHQGTYQNITGRKFFFKTYDTSDNEKRAGKLTKFKRPEMVNYPVQSFSTADVHMIALGMLWRQAIKFRDKFVLINTVHDSVMIDCKPEHLDFTCILVKTVLESVVSRLKGKFNIDFDLPLNVEVSFGPSWADQTEYEFNQEEITNATNQR